MPKDDKIIELIHADFDAVATAMVSVPDPQKPLSATHLWTPQKMQE